jgi:short-subunit dehydrogenase
MLITGSTDGFGKRLVLILAGQGQRSCRTARNRKRGERSWKKLRAASINRLIVAKVGGTLL